jgi:hypothetical protein
VFAPQRLDDDSLENPPFLVPAQAGRKKDHQLIEPGK